MRLDQYMSGWERSYNPYNEVIKYMTDLGDTNPFRSTYKPTWYIDTEGTLLNSTCNFRPTKVRRMTPTEDKIDEEKLGEIL